MSAGRGGAADEDRSGERTGTGSCQAAPGLEHLMWHASDTVARPLVGNKAVERGARPICDLAALPFTALVLAKMGETTLIHPQLFCSGLRRQAQ